MINLVSAFKFFIFIVNFDLILSDQYDNLIEKSDIFYMNSNKLMDARISDIEFSNNIPDVKIIIHGYMASKTHIATAPLRYAYLGQGHPAVLVADWKEASEVFYPISRYFVTRIGRRFYYLINEFIMKNNISSENVHIIGHSLGAHIAGIIGRYFGGKMGRITGLDPASPLFENNAPDSLASSDALFVDVIHSDSPILGSLTPRGHVDFYPNYGIGQPGCGTLDLLTFTACSHYRASLFYAETIALPENFPSIPCNLGNIKRRRCTLKSNDFIVYMGDSLPPSTRGSYYLRTNDISPFGIGSYSKYYEEYLVENSDEISDVQSEENNSIVINLFNNSNYLKSILFKQ